MLVAIGDGFGAVIEPAEAERLQDGIVEAAGSGKIGNSIGNVIEHD